MYNSVESLSKNPVLNYFKEISNIPRGSGNEKEISDYFVAFAKKRDLEVIQDETLNVIIKKPATLGFEDVPTVILQGHVDMVCEKNKGIEHDFEKDPLKLRIIDDMIYATDTTLGADNGIALAYALALMDSKNIPHPNLEILLTTEEESTMNGAASLDGSLFEGKILINLDSEEEGKLLVSSAGGIDVEQVLPIKWKEIYEEYTCLNIHIKGLKGGHSGMAIDKGRGNSNKIMGRLLAGLNNKFSYFVTEINGGSKVNAIPRESEVKLLISPDMENDFIVEINTWEKVFKSEFRIADPDLRIYVEKVKDFSNKGFSKETTDKLIDTLILIPNGVNTMSMDIEGLVESSNNLGLVYNDDKNIFFQSEIRSAVKSLRSSILNQMKTIAKLLDCEFNTYIEYPEWVYNPDSRIRELCIKTYKERYGKEPEIIACHAGIESSILIDKILGLDAISIGPDMYEVHNPSEHVSISSTLRTWDFLLEILANIKNY
ncbi:aminoacyl-histidine dipeptidase [Clostridium tetani]|uniref:aminoacyl-histidine dipeptidase n=1 Tax=Clostridium tetani TaxID=1513 RepID=UPI00100B179B|nr:aminoacyl-histidine dipeptidase [Clostridium tetani]RXI53623.1 aminoacyl-histidine dipeptidase [Clostridium tetani]RXI55625.1 aminoacyl-histidine dipeptidase [Clostridium tetani]RXM71019.1 aminoacyl-histidine dipeptidase [Clostridium tetani]BDR79228.1 aminoacyl-histidine dipeptidase [Clostridium tetani]